MLGMCAFGLIARHLKYIDEDDVRKWNKFIMDFLIPMLIFSSLIKSFNREQALDMWPLPFMGLLMIFIGTVIGYIFRFGLKNQNDDSRKMFVHMCAFSNTVMLPVVIWVSIYEPGMAWVFIMSLGLSSAFWGYGTFLLAGSKITLREKVKNIFSINFIVLILTLTMCLLDIPKHLPHPAIVIADGMGKAAIPLILIILGASVYSTGKRIISFDVIYVAIFRLFIIPIVLIVVICLLPLSKEVFHHCLVVALMPVALNTTSVAKRYGGDSDFAAKCVIVTMIASMVTIPVSLMTLHKMGIWIGFD
jgi:hypothetical protein